MRWPKDHSPGSEHILCKGDYSSTTPDQTGKRWELYVANHKNLTFVVDDVSHATYAYEPAANTDSDGDSDGTAITVNSP